MAEDKRRVTRCPECRDVADPAYRPFCSKRCADVDLARWLTGGYSIPAADVSEDDAEDEGSVQAH